MLISVKARTMIVEDGNAVTVPDGIPSPMVRGGGVEVRVDLGEAREELIDEGEVGVI